MTRTMTHTVTRTETYRRGHRQTYTHTYTPWLLFLTPERCPTRRQRVDDKTRLAAAGPAQRRFCQRRAMNVPTARPPNPSRTYPPCATRPNDARTECDPLCAPAALTPRRCIHKPHFYTTLIRPSLSSVTRTQLRSSTVVQSRPSDPPSPATNVLLAAAAAAGAMGHGYERPTAGDTTKIAPVDVVSASD